MRYDIALFATMVFMFSCNKNKEIIQKTPDYKTIGDSITIKVQGELLNNLTKTITDSGIVSAIKYCNINAIPITNREIPSGEIISVQRLSDKNRNPNNKLSSEMDKNVFEYFKRTPKDTVILEASKVAYYKPIKVMMSTCLQCHGDTKSISPTVLKTIKELYPYDLAINYKEGDLRGMWKIMIRK